MIRSRRLRIYGWVLAGAVMSAAAILPNHPSPYLFLAVDTAAYLALIGGSELVIYGIRQYKRSKSR